MQRAFGAVAAVDARRPEEDDGVLDLLVGEPAARLEVFGEDADGAPFGALEKAGVR